MRAQALLLHVHTLHVPRLRRRRSRVFPEGPC